MPPHMAPTRVEDLLEQAKALSESDRARLVHELLITLDGQPDSDVSTAWEQELKGRLAEVTEGTAETITREELTQRLQNRIR